MNIPVCPACKYDHEHYQVPLGKTIRNRHADLTKAIYDDCSACAGSGQIPKAVVESINNFAGSQERAQEILAKVGWNRDHFYFNHPPLYIGIEVDGFMHS